MKIYTKTGDKGQTSLLRGGRVAKHHPRVEAYGTFDELNSLIGVVRTLNQDEVITEILADLQPRLHRLCSDVAAAVEGDGDSTYKLPRIRAEEVIHLEQLIDRMDEELPPLTHFILPGGSPAGANLHLARTVCRRGERRLTELLEAGEPINQDAMMFVNRLSDMLFTLARYANFRAGQEEIPWTDGK